jgi:phenylacetate-coenzyme A ligase PaaK-like adenylate-forming protein
VRARVEAAFGVGVTDQFGSTEGVIGVSAPGDPAMVLASDLAIVELVDDGNQPVPPGTPSAKALVTNLVNLTQPLIRYELTDRFVRQPDADDHGHLRVTVEGRADDLLRYGELVIHPLGIRSALVSTPEVVEYQVRQTPNGIDVAVIAADELDERSLSGRLAVALRRPGRPAGRRAPGRRARPRSQDRQDQALHDESAARRWRPATCTCRTTPCLTPTATPTDRCPA